MSTRLLGRIPDSAIEGCGKAAAFLAFVITVALAGHTHASSLAQYLHSVFHDEALIAGWSVTLMLTGSAYGVATGSPMPTLEGVFLAAALSFGPAIAPPAAEPVIELLVLIWLASSFLRFGEAAVAVPVLVTCIAVTGSASLLLCLLPRLRRQLALRLSGDTREFIDFSVSIVLFFCGLPVILAALLLAIYPPARPRLERALDWVLDVGELTKYSKPDANAVA